MNYLTMRFSRLTLYLREKIVNYGHSQANTIIVKSMHILICHILIVLNMKYYIDNSLEPSQSRSVETILTNVKI